MANPREELQLDLHDIVIGGLAEYIRQARESAALCEEFRIKSSKLEEDGFGHLFDRLQIILGRYALLAVSRLFDPESEHYPLKSIPVALNYLRFHADYLEFKDRETVINRLIAFGHQESQFENIPDPWLTQLLRKEFADRLPDAKNPDASDLSRALDAIRIACEKTDIDHATGVAAERDFLLQYATDFVRTAGKGYLDIDFEAESEGITTDLKQLLAQAGIAM